MAIITANFLFIEQKIRINNQITAPELRVIDERGGNLGTMKTNAALALANESGLDLIEVSPNATPPVARILSFDKFRYEQEKKEKKLRVRQKSGELKQIQISVKEARHDLGRKANKISEFLKEGYRVEILVVMRGREKMHKEWAGAKLDEFLKMIDTEYKVMLGQKRVGKGIIIQIIRK